MSAIGQRLGRVSLTERKRKGEPAGKAGDLLRLLEVFDFGLTVTAEGALVWVVRIEPRNWTLLSALERGLLSVAMAKLSRQPQAGEVLQFVIESTPIDWRRVLAATRREVETVAGPRPGEGREAADPAARARWLLYGAMERSVAAQARTAMATDCYMIVPYTRHASTLQGYLAQLQAGGMPAGPLRMTSDEIGEAISESREYVEDLCEILERAGMRTMVVAGEEVLDRHWRQFNPTSALEEPSCPQGAEIVGSLHPREELEDAREAARVLRERLARSNLDFSADARVAEIEDDLVAHFYVKGEVCNVQTGWLYESLRSLQLPWRVCVFVHGLDRKLERAKLKGRQNKDHGLEAESRRKNQPVNVDRQLRLQETEELLAKMSSEQRTVLNSMSIYGSVSYPGPVADRRRAKAELRRAVRRVREAVRERAEATVSDGFYVQRELFEAGQALGRDVARRTKKYTNEVIGATVVPPGTRIGSPFGPPLLTSFPGRTIERVHPFDRRHENLVAVVTGAAGSGKTMLANTLLGRTLAAGMSWFVLDRAGHYRLLCELIGGQHVDLGADGCRYAINPWDVDDLSTISGQKVQRLLALHRLLIGENRRLSPQEIGQLEAAIRHAYALAAEHGEQPRESHLYEALLARAERETSTGALESAADLRNLAERLGPFCRGGVCGKPLAADGGGAYAYLLDRETTVPEGSPMVVFDTRQVDEAIMPAVAFSLVETVRTLAERHFDRLALSAEFEAEFEELTEMRLAGRLGLAMDEVWSLLLHADTASHIADLGKRHRHWALFTLVISQQLADFASQHGRAFLDNSSMKWLGKQRNDDEVRLACELYQLASGEREGLASLQMQQDEQRRDSRWLWLNGAVGRGLCSLALSSLEYWAYTSDMREDVPLRRRKIEEHNGDVWRALIDLAENHPRGIDAR